MDNEDLASAHTRAQEVRGEARVSTPYRPFTTLLVKDSFGST
jgi:hypothetical protein